MSTIPTRRHALGLPAGSIRAAHLLVIVGVTCALIINPMELRIAIPPYLVYLVFLMLGHYFASHGVTIATREDPEASPLYLPGGAVRLLVILALGGAIGWKLYQSPDSLRQQFELTLDELKTQPYLPLIILGGFFVGVILRTIVGRTNPPQWWQDFEAWLSLVALLGLGAAAIIHLIVTASLETPMLPMPMWEGILGAMIAFYFGERS